MMLERAPLQHHATIDSTNLEARRLQQAGERGPVFILADEQTAGRGRMQRQWYSSPGNCYSTLLLPLTTDLTSVAQLGFVAALAVADTVQQHSTAKAELKWPNDVLVRGAKISGILCEVLSATPVVVAIGCGINVSHAPENLVYPATCLAAHSGSANRDAVFETYRARLAYWLALWDGGAGFDAITAHWARRAIGFGEKVVMRAGDAVTEGVLHGLGLQGALLLRRPDGDIISFLAGDLTIPSLQEQRSKPA